MFAYGIPPNADEIEVIVFGPGYGEAIAVHLGDNRWLLIDSCINTHTKLPAALEYLQTIGIGSDRVEFVIASHWHDDHVKGFSEITTECNNATLVVSDVFNDREAFALLSAYGNEQKNPQGRGARELYKAVKIKRHPFLVFASQQTTLFDEQTAAGRIRVMAFSPTHAAKEHAIAHLASFLPAANASIGHIPKELAPNLEAVVVHVQIDGDAVLLGSDLEHHGQLGWESIVNSPMCLGASKASLYKVAHHGSQTAEHPDIWARLLHQHRTTVLTPFINGKVHLPTELDKERIRSNSIAAYTSSASSKKPKLDSSQKVKRLHDVTNSLSVINPGFGAVRFRKKNNEALWREELFGSAARL